jgi:hypothetical protein
VKSWLFEFPVSASFGATGSLLTLALLLYISRFHLPLPLDSGLFCYIVSRLHLLLPLDSRTAEVASLLELLFLAVLLVEYTSPLLVDTLA